jgi:hypothetical protein
MSTCYEFGFACDLKSGLSQEVIDTLKYMTRSEEYEFKTTLTDDLFISSWEEGSFEDAIEDDGSIAILIDFLRKMILMDLRKIKF